MTDQITVPRATWDAMRGAHRKLIRAYVNLLESGRDRIISLGGTCDPVDQMEAGDPALREAKAALTAANAVSGLTNRYTVQPQAQGEAWKPDFEHLANEWADAATNGPTILDLVRDGVYTFEKAKEMMAADFAHCREVGARVRAASHPQATEPAWRPIETAPKDGSEILLGHPDGSLTVGWWRARNPSQGWTDGDSYAMGWPTHWQPAPAAPEAKQ